MNDADLARVLCELLGEVPGWHWHPTAAPPAGAVGIFYGDIPETPDRAIGVRVYGGTDDPVVYQPTRQAQLRIRGARGDLTDADRIAGFAFALLQGRTRVRGISRIERDYFGPLGADTNGREERSENYTVRLDNVEAGHAHHQ
ncbi:minor capsid protein [Cellulosimicrobium funkei]|uniref:minor capsid protein n=1 Tax=Cellulosimicrobium funkei TaxID=264251 RepID=UPI003683F28A